MMNIKSMLMLSVSCLTFLAAKDASANLNYNINSVESNLDTKHIYTHKHLVNKHLSSAYFSSPMAFNLRGVSIASSGSNLSTSGFPQTASVCFVTDTEGCKDGKFSSGGDYPEYNPDPDNRCKKEGYLKTSCDPLYEPYNYCPYDRKYWEKCVCKAGLVNCSSPYIGVGTSCDGKYASCVCDAKYKYNSSNCSGSLGGGSCDGKYATCTCSVRTCGYTSSSRPTGTGWSCTACTATSSDCSTTSGYNCTYTAPTCTVRTCGYTSSNKPTGSGWSCSSCTATSSDCSTSSGYNCTYTAPCSDTCPSYPSSSCGSLGASDSCYDTCGGKWWYKCNTSSPTTCTVTTCGYTSSNKPTGTGWSCSACTATAANCSTSSGFNCTYTSSGCSVTTCGYTSSNKPTGTGWSCSACTATAANCSTSSGFNCTYTAPSHTHAYQCDSGWSETNSWGSGAQTQAKKCTANDGATSGTCYKAPSCTVKTCGYTSSNKPTGTGWSCSSCTATAANCSTSSGYNCTYTAPAAPKCSVSGYYNGTLCSTYTSFRDCASIYQKKGEECWAAGRIPSPSAGDCDVDSMRNCCEQCTGGT